MVLKTADFIKKTRVCNPRRLVRINGLEPLRLSPLDPKSSAATNYAISALHSTISNKMTIIDEIAKIHLFFDITKKCSSAISPEWAILFSFNLDFVLI